jgi:Arc/MetJ-type ribon-helix-helix transcriptional regulator
MSAAPPTELELFHRFLGEKISNGSRDLALEEAVKAFRDYQEQLARLRREIQPALEGSLRGECQPFDAEALKQRITEQLASRGIAE